MLWQRWCSHVVGSSRVFVFEVETFEQFVAGGPHLSIQNGQRSATTMFENSTAEELRTLTGQAGPCTWRSCCVTGEVIVSVGLDGPRPLSWPVWTGLGEGLPRMIEAFVVDLG